MIPLVLSASLALAHGGEDHGAPATVAPPTHADTAQAVASSNLFEAVVRVPRVTTDSATEVSLLLADYATSAPVEGATASLTLSGPATVQVELGSAGPPGAYHGSATFPAHGEYTGALVVTESPEKTDLLAISGLQLAPPAVATSAPSSVGSAATIAALGAGLAGIVIGWIFGRRRTAAAAAFIVIGGMFGARRVEAHGGEDHGEPGAAPTAPPGSALNLPMDGQFLVGLRTAVLTREVFQERVPALGRFVARPGQAATLGAPNDRVLVAPPNGFPTPGQAVRAGDTLAVLREVPTTADRATITQERTGAATRVAEARSALALAERDAAGIDALGNALSERERLALRNAVEVARVTLREAEAALAALSTGVTVPIKAPVDGRLGAISVRPGDQVSAGQALFRVVDPAGLWMQASVPERLALGLVPGATAVVTPAAAPERTLAATVLDAGQEADPDTGSVAITLAVEAGEPGLLPGMGGTAWVGRGAARDALVAPAAAVIDSNGVPLAFVKTGPETFEARELRLGARAGGTVEVLSGLSAGARVVTEGTYTLRSLAGR